MNVFEFLNLVKKEPEKWINYCEIIILKNGSIELARPSHNEKVIDIYCKKEGITREQFKEFPIILDPLSFICEKYSMISIWYNYMKGPYHINRFQQRTINLLKKNKLISNYSNYEIASDYSWYIKNKKHVRRFLNEK